MQKTKLGFTIGMLSAIVYFAALFGGYTPLFILAGYILLCEQNDWLRMVSLKAIVLKITFSVISAVIELIPSALNCLNRLLSVFEAGFSYNTVSNLVSFLNGVVNIAEIVIFLMLAFKAMKLKDIKIAKINQLIEN